MDRDEALGDEVAQLEVLRRLALGAAHTLSNALTAILGEAHFLAEERKGDPEVADACASIVREVERCARLARALGQRGERCGPAPAAEGELDLASLGRSLAPLLRDTVTRAVDIDWRLPEGAELARGDRGEVDRLILLCAYRLVRGVAPGSALRISLVREAGAPLLAFELRAPTAPAPATCPDAAESEWDRAVAQAAQSLAARNGVRIEAPAAGRAVRLRFASPSDDLVG